MLQALLGGQDDGAGFVHRGGRQQDAGLLHIHSGQGDVAGRGADDPGIRDRATIEDVEDQAAQTRIAAGRDVNGRAGREHGLAILRRDASVVLDIGAKQKDVAASDRDGPWRGGLNTGTSLHEDIACWATDIGKDRGKQVARIIERRRIDDPLLFELVITDIEGRCDQRADIDLARAAEDDAVLVDDIDLAVGLDIAKDLTWTEIADHPVQCNPVSVAMLIERERGLGADIECIPVQDRLRGGLVDADIALTAGNRLCRQVGALPQRRARCRPGRDLQPALGEAVRHHDLR